MLYSYQKLGNWGALGNQLFEIAGTLGIALKNGGTVSFPDWAYRKYFSVPDSYFSNKKGDVDFSEDYLQDYHYFESIEGLIRQYFSPSDPVREYLKQRYPMLYGAHGKFTEYIGVHVRRANNMNLPMHHPVCDLDYFEQGIDYVKSKTPYFYTKILVVFSDDIEWCKQQSIFKDAIFAEGNDPSIEVSLLTNGWPLALASVAYDFHLMRACNHFVISNSTFSWWGAYLGYDLNHKIVVAPKPWYGRALTHIDVESTLIMPRWHQIEREIP